MVIAARGCGVGRTAGGIYIVVPLGYNGSPVEHFIVDPPEKIDADALGITALGTKIIEHDGVYHVFDIVGKRDYPNVADFVEEVRHLGLSRRISKTTDFELLTPESRIFLIHERAWIENRGTYYADRGKDDWWCPKNIEAHIDPLFTGVCASLWWEDVREATPAVSPEATKGALCLGTSYKDEKGRVIGNHISDQTGLYWHGRRDERRAVVRTMPSFEYRGFAPPVATVPTQYAMAIFASFRINMIEVVTDRAGGSHLDALGRAGKSSLPIVEVDE